MLLGLAVMLGRRLHLMNKSLARVQAHQAHLPASVHLRQAHLRATGSVEAAGYTIMTYAQFGKDFHPLGEDYLTALRSSINSDDAVLNRRRAGGAPDSDLASQPTASLVSSVRDGGQHGSIRPEGGGPRLLETSCILMACHRKRQTSHFVQLELLPR